MKERAFEARGGFAGGLNVAVSPDMLNPDELLRCYNARVEPGGSVSRRQGSRKLNSVALGTGGEFRIRGVHYWEPGGVGQLVAIAGGRLYYAASPFTTYSEIIPGVGDEFDTGTSADFAQFYDVNGFVLYIASKGKVYRWSGTVLTRIDGTNGVPTASCLRAFGTRLFMNSRLNKKTLYWSKIGNGSVFTVGGLSDGGFAQVDVNSGDSLSALETVAGSLLIASRDSIARFSGDSDNIRIAQDTQGVSTEAGPGQDADSNAVGGFQRVESGVLMWTARGPYVVSDAAAVSIGKNIQTTTNLDILQPAAGATIVHNRRRKTIWFTYQSMNNGANARNTLEYDYTTGAWSGPFIWPFAPLSAATYVSGGKEKIVFGCNDGFLRDPDDPASVSTLDDAAVDYAHDVIPAPFMFANAGPHNTKSLRHVFVQLQRAGADTLAAQTLVVSSAGGVGPTVNGVLVSVAEGVGVPANVRYDVNIQGKRFRVQWYGTHVATSPGDLVTLVGLLVSGSVMDRW